MPCAALLTDGLLLPSLACQEHSPYAELWMGELYEIV